MKRTHNPNLYLDTPNGADENYFASKALDILTGLLTVVGFTAAMVVLVTLA